jgi:hypothetical protein
MRTNLPFLWFLIAMTSSLLFLACTYDNEERSFYLQVENGTGTGWYTPNTLVEVSATPAAMHRFLGWEGDTVFLLNPLIPQTECTMPYRDMAIQAYCLPKGVISFRYEVMPIIVQYCALSGCHKNSIKQANFEDHASVASHASRIEDFVIPDMMPLNGPLPAAEKQLLLTWISQGSQNN